MPTARDVAQYIVERHGPMSTMKLQKLVYYSQAWSVVWDDDVLFPDKIEAWQNGPVVRDLWEAARRKFRVEGIETGDACRLSDPQRETVDKVLEFYGDRDAQWLSDLTHMEDPWRNAFAGGMGVNAEITPAALIEYYASLTEDDSNTRTQSGMSDVA